LNLSLELRDFVLEPTGIDDFAFSNMELFLNRLNSANKIPVLTLDIDYVLFHVFNLPIPIENDLPASFQLK
jgi:hypothetical protein